MFVQNETKVFNNDTKFAATVKGMVIIMNSIIKLKENRDFRRAYGRGKSFVSPSVVVYVLKNRNNNVRLGITTGKKIGNAVSRNRAKRVITAAFRFCLPNIKKGYDFVIVARTRVLSTKSTEVASSMIKQLKLADVWETPKTDEQITDKIN